MKIERYTRLMVKACLFIFALIALLDAEEDSFDLTGFGGIPVKPIAASWMLLSIIITGIREFRYGYQPFYLTIPEFALCLIGIIGVTNSLTLFYYGYSDIPSFGTMLGFFTFWAVHTLLQIARVRYLRVGYFLTISIGIIGVLGWVLNVPLMRFEITDAANEMAIFSALFLVALGWAAYSREREGP